MPSVRQSPVGDGNAGVPFEVGERNGTYQPFVAERSHDWVQGTDGPAKERGDLLDRQRAMLLERSKDPFPHAREGTGASACVRCVSAPWDRRN